jgi:DegV family protein with EDD domain
MGNVAIVTDTLACLPKELVNKYNISIVPIIINFKGKAYRDTIDLSTSQAYELFLQDPDSFATSPASPMQYLDVFREASHRAKEIFCISVSAHLSTSYNVARIAAEQISTEMPDVRIQVLNCDTVLAAQGFVALASAQAVASCNSLTGALKTAQEVKKRVTFALVLETIRHVYRTGRVPRVATEAASLFHIKPILTCREGTVRLVSLSRNMKQGIDHIIRTMKLKVGENPVHVAVMHAYAPEEAEKLSRRISSEFNCTELWTTEVNPVVGYAIGAGAVGFAYYDGSEIEVPV